MEWIGVRDLVALEQDFDLCSSFNFIPEGTYRVPRELREWLTELGFEVGVHDLHHDGHLYSSRENFRRNAERINHYLKDWDADGFRSGFMLNRLDWLHDLEAGYDASTFDTDPFEPQPKGRHTIFPFHVENEQDSEENPYVELPYTLPQDSTLFLLLGQTDIEIWKRKLDWVAKHGGLALVIIHPDYVEFEGKSAPAYSDPEKRLRDLFDYLNTRYQGTFWNPKAADLACWYRQTMLNQNHSLIPSTND